MKLHKIFFWVHLISGLIAGLVIALMSLTGVAIAFEEEILHWIDRDVSTVTPPRQSVAPRTIATLADRVRAQRPEFKLDRLLVHRDPGRAFEAYAGREGPLYVDPFNGHLTESRSHSAHDVLHTLEGLHRWLGMSGDGRAIGKAITGVSNLAFLVLCLTGLYIWFPGRWTWRAFRTRMWFKRTNHSKARDFNWHHVLGWWSLPPLLILVVTGVVISFEWAHKLVFVLAGEAPPIHRNFRMTFVPPVEVPDRGDQRNRVSWETILASVAAKIPEWKTMSLKLEESPPAHVSPKKPKAAPIQVAVTVPDYMPNRAYIPVEVDPFDGQVLRCLRLQSRSTGLQARIWMRFLHTGAAFGLPGKIVATLATLASLVLVYTGFALSYRRFIPRGGRRQKAPGPRGAHAFSSDVPPILNSSGER